MLRKTWGIVRDTYSESMADRVPRMGAAIAYYMTFSLAPLLLVIVAIAGLIYGQQAAHGQLFKELRSVVGDDVAKTSEALISAADGQGAGVVASCVAAVTALIGALGVFSELQDSLNTVLRFDRSRDGMWVLVQRRFLAFLLVLGFGFLLVASLALSTVMTVVNGMLASRDYARYVPPALMTSVPHAVSFVLVTIIFAMIYRFLPDDKMKWRSVWLGSLVGATLFTLGKSLLGYYLGHVAATSVYGAAASLVVLMLWNYYTAQIILVGAEVIKAHDRQTGSHHR